MSDAPGQTGPDLHAIFGMDTDVGAQADPVVEVEHAVATEDVAEDVREDPETSLEPDVEVDAIASQPGEWTGITRPSRRGSSSRFLTDVIVDMGLASRGQVDEAIESSRGLGTTPERVLLDAACADPRRALARAGRALRPGPSRPRRLFGRHVRRQPRDHARGQALPGRARRVRRQAHAAGGDGRPRQRPGRRRHRDHDRLRGARRGRPAR